MRAYEHGDQRVEIAIAGGAVVVRRFTRGELIAEDTHEHASPLAAKWDADRRAGEQVAGGLSRVSDDVDLPQNQIDLVAAIAASPDDLDGYLVFADWLSERGDPWGQLIAIQHALALLPRFGSTPRRDELSRLEVTLRFEHAARLFGPLGETIVDTSTQTYAFSLIDTDWRCGFVRTARIADTERLGPALLAEIARLDVMQLLHRLEVAAPPHRPRRDRPWLDAASLAPLVVTLPVLRELVVEWTENTDALCVALAASPIAPRLEELRIDASAFTPAGIAALARAPFASLRVLRLTGLGPETATRDLAHLAGKHDIRLTDRPDYIEEDQW
jgi:uncharacterized protein (TIGR02996 family)